MKSLIQWLRSRTAIIQSHKRLERKLELSRLECDQLRLINRMLTEQVGQFKAEAELAQARAKFLIHNMGDAPT